MSKKKHREEADRIEASKVERTGWLFTLLYIIPLELAAAGLFITGFKEKTAGFKFGALLVMSAVCTVTALLLGKALFAFLYSRFLIHTENRLRSRKLAAITETVLFVIFLGFMLLLYKLN
ncbi:MAG: hypothetical protein J5501_01680 [Ruminococcus sp.]|nr:hypothetical protein [Ruminococcus sp.]